MTGACSTRAGIALMLFTATFISYMLRVNMAINIIAMVEPRRNENNAIHIPECILRNDGAILISNSTFDNTTLDSGGGNKSAPDYGTRYKWDSKIQGYILGAYFWGAIITCIPGGLLAEKVGATKVVLITTLLGGFITLAIPIAASIHYMAVIFALFLLGLMGGVLYPCLHCLVSQWAPPEEKGKFTGALLGGSLGAVATLPLCGSLIQSWGWKWAFFVPGGLAILWCALWYFMVADTPEKHPRVSMEERTYIQDALKSSLNQNKKGLPPYLKIMSSVRFWAFVVLHYGNLWGLYFLMTAGPTFVSKVLGFDLKSSGFVSSLPYLARLVFGLIFGYIGDFLKSKEVFKPNTIRKSFITFSHFVPGILLCVLTTVGCDIFWCVFFITMSLGSNGASTLTNLQNSQDLAPNYAGSLYGIANCIGTTTGFITPLIVGYMTQEKNGIAEWRIIFFIGASVYIASGIFFLIFGTSEIQPWNFEQEEPKEKTGFENQAYVASNETHRVSDRLQI